MGEHCLERLKARVSVKQLQKFDLHALQGLTAKETARTLGSILMAVHMATSRLRRLLKRGSLEFRGRKRAAPIQQDARRCKDVSGYKCSNCHAINLDW